MSFLHSKVGIYPHSDTHFSSFIFSVYIFHNICLNQFRVWFIVSKYSHWSNLKYCDYFSSFVYLFIFVEIIVYFYHFLSFYEPVTHSQILLQKYKFLCSDTAGNLSVSCGVFFSWSSLSSWFYFSFLSILHLSNFFPYLHYPLL